MTFAEALASFDEVFRLAASGETVVIEREENRVAVRPLPNSGESAIAPPGYFADDYSSEETAELNALASQSPVTVQP